MSYLFGCFVLFSSPCFMFWCNIVRSTSQVKKKKKNIKHNSEWTFRGLFFWSTLGDEQKTFSVFSQRQKLQEKCVRVALRLSKTDGTTSQMSAATHLFTPLVRKKKNQHHFTSCVFCINYALLFSYLLLFIVWSCCRRRFSLEKHHQCVYILFDVGGETITLSRTI